MQGLETIVSIGKQAGATNPTTLARQNLQVYSITGGQDEPFETDNILGGGLQNASDPTGPAPGLDDHRLTIVAPICLTQLPFWLSAFFGTPVTDDANDPDFVHDWKSGQALPYVFLEHRLKSGDFRFHYGLVGESIEVDFEAERAGYGKVTMTFVGLSEAESATALPGTVTAAPELDRPAAKLVNVIYNSVSGGDLMGGKFKFTRVLKRLRAADGTGLPNRIEIDGISSLEGSVHVRYATNAYFNDGRLHTERAMSIELMRTAAAGVKWDLPHLRVRRSPIDIGGPEGVEQNIDFRAWQTQSDAALGVSVLNGEASAVLGP